jgi:tungstate transport system ATP-binding protein
MKTFPTSNPPVASLELGILPLELTGVGLVRDGKRVLKDLNCRIEGGASGQNADEPAKTFIIGPNGAGKTLFLKLCHGLIQPDEGEVRWYGPAANDGAMIKRRQAMVFQRPVLLRRTAWENIDFVLKIRGVTRAERADRCAELLQQTGLGRHASTQAQALSFGEQQRLALARALAPDPEILFLDEPTASLDPASAHLVEDLIDQAVTSGKKIVMSSHDLGQAKRLADEIIFIHRGRIKERAAAPAFFNGPENDLARDFLEGKLLWWRRRSVYEEGEEQCC